jgi:1,4-dihydroxy-6-naphthoate synthase
MLLTIAYPAANDKKEYLFSDIEEVVLSDEADAGLLIHETRFTYQQKGLHKILDLGKYWEETTSMPLPLGGIAVRRSLPQDMKQELNRILTASVEYAMQNPDLPDPFIKLHAQEMDINVCRKHVGLYVNDFSIDLGAQGRQAVNFLFEKGLAAKFFTNVTQPVFVDDLA